MIKIAPVNKNNFVRWYPNVTATIDNSIYTEGIHNGYHYRWRTFADYLPVLVGDTLTIYTNFDSPTYLTSKSIKVVEESSCGAYTVINDATKYDVSAVTWGDNNAKITLNIPVTNTYNLKKFRLAIVDVSDVVSYVSNYFMVSQRTEKNINNTHLLSFYHTSNIFNYEWAGFDSATDDYYTIRVASSKVGVEFPSEREFYTEATTGKPRTTRSLTKKQISFEIYFASEELHDAISVFTSFKYFGINGNEYLVEALEVDYNKIFNLFKSVLSIKDIEFDRRVNVCNTLS